MPDAAVYAPRREHIAGHITDLVADWCAAEMTRRADAMEADLVEAVALQDFDMLDRLVIVAFAVDLSRPHIPDAVASMLLP